MTSPMRITFLLPAYMSWPVGSYRQFFEYANRLSHKGHDVDIVMPGTSRRHWVKSCGQPVLRHVPRLRMFPWFELDPGVGLRYVMDRPGWSIPATDVLVFTGWETTRHHARLARCTRVSVQFALDYAFWAVAEPERKRRIEEGLSHSDIPIIAGSKVIASMLEGLGRDALDIVCAGVDTSVFRQTKPTSGRGDVIGLCPRPSPVKGASDGFAALAILRERGIPFRAVAVSPHMPPNAPDWIHRLTASDDDAMNDFYNDCSVFMHPSRYEGFGLPALEAMACGAAVASTDNGGIRDFARPGENLLLSPIEDAEALADNLTLLMTDDALRQRLVEGGAATAREFNWDRPVEQLEAAFSSLLATS